MKSSPVLSVCLITYNHGRYVKQALESIIKQQTNFEYEIVAGDDNSSDGTRELLREYQRRYPEKIRLLLNEKRLGIVGNWLQTLQNCHGKFIAILEGDDYWLDPLKLQKQHDFLRRSTEFTVCFHNAYRFYESLSAPLKSSKLFCSPQLKSTLTIDDILRKNFVPTNSIMMKNFQVSSLPAWIHELSFIDWPLLVLAARYGKLYYMKEPMGVYRINPYSSTAAGRHDPQNHINHYRNIISFYYQIDKELNYKYQRIIKSRIAHSYYGLAIRHEQNHDHHAACASLRTGLTIHPTPVSLFKMLSSFVYMNL